MRRLHSTIIISAACILSACETVGTQSGAIATSYAPSPAYTSAPDPIEGNEGKFMSPYTSDEVVAEWVDKAISAKMGAAVGGQVGRYAGEKMAENVPFFGAFIGKSVGEAAGRRIALQAVGGEAFMRETSDMSFMTINDMARHLHAEHSDRENFAEVLAATQEIYPELETAYLKVSQSGR